MANRQPATGDWKHGLCECHCPDCALACFFYPCYACCVAKAAGKKGCSACVHCLFPGLLCCLRGELRDQRGIQGNCCKDFLTVLCCDCCAAVQMKKELE